MGRRTEDTNVLGMFLARSDNLEQALSRLVSQVFSQSKGKTIIKDGLYILPDVIIIDEVDKTGVDGIRHILLYRSGIMGRCAEFLFDSVGSVGSDRSLPNGLQLGLNEEQMKFAWIELFAYLYPNLMVS